MSLVFQNFYPQAIEHSDLSSKDKTQLTTYGFPSCGYVPVIYDYYTPCLEAFSIMYLQDVCYVGIAFDVGTGIYLSIQTTTGYLVFLYVQHHVVDILNTDDERFIQSIRLCDTFFNKHQDFLKDIIAPTDENKSALIKLQHELILLDPSLWRDSSNGWAVFIEELSYLIED